MTFVLHNFTFLIIHVYCNVQKYLSMKYLEEINQSSSFDSWKTTNLMVMTVNLSKTKLLMFSPKSIFPAVLAILVNSSNFQLFKPKTLALAFILLYLTSHSNVNKFCQSDLQNVSRIQSFLKTFPATSVVQATITVSLNYYNVFQYVFLFPLLAPYSLFLTRVILLKHKSGHDLLILQTLQGLLSHLIQSKSYYCH